MLEGIKYNQGRFWIFWQGITCLLGVIVIVGPGIIGVAQGQIVISNQKLSYDPIKSIDIAYYSSTSLDIWLTPESGTVCNFFYKAYKSTTWLPIASTNCRITMTKALRANNLVLDIKVVTTSPTNPTNTITDSYVFSSR